jgi:hypothetical protein
MEAVSAPDQNPSRADLPVSGVAGFTYNFKNPDTQYRSGA